MWWLAMRKWKNSFNPKKLWSAGGETKMLEAFEAWWKE